MSARPPWVPADVADEDVAEYMGTIRGHQDRLNWYARELSAPHLVAAMDQLQAKIRDRRDAVLGTHWSADGEH